MQGNHKRNRLRLGSVPTIDVPVRVEPCFKLLRETEKKRSATRVKVSNISGRSNSQKSGCKRTHEDQDSEDGESSSDSKTDSSITKECTEQQNRRKCPKLDQQGVFLMAIGLVHIDNVR